MTYADLRRRVLALIEALSPAHPLLTDDADLAAKLPGVANQVIHEITRLKKLPVHLEMSVTKGQFLDFADLAAVCGKEIYQISLLRGVNLEVWAGGTLLKILEDGLLQVDAYAYPPEISPDTAEGFPLELPRDLLEILPYGIAADLLKHDVSAERGQRYATRYRELLNLLDPRYALPWVRLEGGVRL